MTAPLRPPPLNPDLVNYEIRDKPPTRYQARPKWELERSLRRRALTQWFLIFVAGGILLAGVLVFLWTLFSVLG